MAKSITFTKDDDINNHKYTKGTTLSVGDKMADDAVSRGVAKFATKKATKGK